MSIDAAPMTRMASRATGLSLTALAAVASPAAEVDFRPTLSFGLFHDGNTAVVGSATGQGDDVAAVAADLAVERRTPDTVLEFSYRPAFVAYRNQRSLNYFGQAVDLNYSRSSSRVARYTFDLNIHQTERQGVRETSPSEAVTFVPRSTQTHVGLRAHGAYEGRRNLTDWEARASLEDYSAPRGSETSDPPSCTVAQDCDDQNSCTDDACIAGSCQHQSSPNCALEDSTNVGAAATWRYEISEQSAVGLGLVLDAMLYDTLPSVYVESFGIVGAHTFDRATSIAYAVGVSRASSTASSDTSLAADVSVARTITAVSSLGAGIRQSVSPGSGLGGVSLDTGGWVAYAHTAPRPGLTGSLTAGYWRRDPLAVGTASADASTTTLSAVASLGWNFNRYLTLNIIDSFADQTSSDPATLDTRYNSYGFSLNWDIRGRRESHR